MTLQDMPVRKFASAVTAAAVAVAITALVNFGGGIWWASALSSRQEEIIRQTDETRLRVVALEQESNRRLSTIAEFRTVQTRVEKLDDAGQAVTQIALAVARLEEQVKAIRETQDSMKRQFERAIIDRLPPDSATH
jgi:low affinity Fe/Cu permease